MIQDQTTKVIYVGNGQTTHFPFKFKYNDKAHIHVAIYDIDTQVQTELTKDFFVDSEKNEVIYPGYQSGQEPPEAQIPPVLQANQKLVIYRQTPLTQEIDFGSKYPLPFVENGTDKNTMLIQEIKEALDRCIKTDMGSNVKPNDLINIIQIKVNETLELLKRAEIANDIAKDNAELSKKWAIDENSPDDIQDYSSPSGKTMSSRSWALLSKIYGESNNVKQHFYKQGMIQDDSLSLGSLVFVQHGNIPFDNNGAMYTITNINDNKSILLNNGKYAKKLRNDIDVDNILLNNFKLNKVLDSFLTFRKIDEVLIVPLGTIVVKNFLYIKDEMFSKKINQKKLILTIKEG